MFGVQRTRLDEGMRRVRRHALSKPALTVDHAPSGRQVK